MLTSEQAQQRLEAMLGGFPQPLRPEYGSGPEGAVMIARAIADLTQAVVVNAEATMLLVETLAAAPVRPGDFRVVEREDDEP